jgi:hypothetical protein
MSISSFRKLGELLGNLTVSEMTSLKHKAISSQVYYVEPLIMMVVVKRFND